jgi:hypothetical protein
VFVDPNPEKAGLVVFAEFNENGAGEPPVVAFDPKLKPLDAAGVADLAAPKPPKLVEPGVEEALFAEPNKPDEVEADVVPKGCVLKPVDEALGAAPNGDVELFAPPNNGLVLLVTVLLLLLLVLPPKLKAVLKKVILLKLYVSKLVKTKIRLN